MSSRNSHGAFRSYFKLLITHYLNHFQTSELGTFVIFNTKIKVAFLWYLEVTEILSGNCNIKCQLRKGTELISSWSWLSLDAFMRLDLHNLFQRGVEPLEKNRKTAKTYC